MTKKIKAKITKLKRNIKKASLSFYVVFSIVIILIYTAVVTVLATTTGYDYSQYYGVFVGCFGGEVLMCALIKIFKLRGENNGLDN